LLLTPHPSVGKKKAKLMAFTDSCRHHGASSSIGQKTGSSNAAAAVVAGAKVEFDKNNDATRNGHNDSLTTLAAVAQAKNVLMKEQLIFQLFMQDPNSAQSKAYFEAMGERYTLQKQQQQQLLATAPTTSSAVLTGQAGCAPHEQEDKDERQNISCR
jgi:hypothetical protein